MKVSERINYIKDWIIEYCNSMKNSPSTLVIGVSGGIDSSLTSTICAMTKKKIIVVSMPIRQDSRQHDLSIAHQDWLMNNFENDWGFETMNAFLIKPKDYIKGTKMAFAGLKKEKDRASIILYLNEQGDQPLQLP